VVKIVVLVKQVPDPEARVTVAADGGPGALQVEDRWCTSYFDEVALEQALTLRQRHGGEVLAVTAGSGKAVDALRRALAFGADRVLQLDDPALAAADGLGLAAALAAVVRREQPELVLAGRQALDDEAGLVGPAVAERLEWPHAADAVALELDPAAKRARVERTVDGGREVLELPLPALVTAQKGLAVPRVPQVTGVMKAMRAKIDKLDLAALGLSAADVAPRTAVLGYRPPPARKPVRMVGGEFPENVRTLAALLRDEAKVL
jgi:electron transfer flavoprotein beta subunit